MDSSLHFICF